VSNEKDGSDRKDGGASELSEDAKKAIHSYLAKLALFFGVPNAIFVLGAFVYVLFLLPGQAAEQANSKLDQEIALIRGALIDSSVEAIEESGKARAAIKRVTDLEPEIAALESNVAALASADAANAGAIINALKANPLAEEALSVVARVETLENRKPAQNACEWTPVAAGGNAVARCPAGKYIAGVRQQYHGGSWRNWVSHVLCCTVF